MYEFDQFREQAMWDHQTETPPPSTPSMAIAAAALAAFLGLAVVLEI